MKFVPLGNTPTISSNHFKSQSPCLRLDSNGFPHISWITLKNGHNEIHYKYWDGSKWNFIGDSSFVSKSKADVIYSPDSLILEGYSNNPSIIFTKNDTNNVNKICLATGNNGIWSISELEVNYNIKWVGTFLYENIPVESSSQSSNKYSSSSSSSSSKDSSSSSSSSSKDSSSSSSSSSNSVSSSSSSSSSFVNETKILIISYDGNNFRIYYTDYNIESPIYQFIQIGQIAETVFDISTLKSCIVGDKIAIAHTYNSTITTYSYIRYNFFDFNTFNWSFSQFTNIGSSLTVGKIRGMNICGRLSINESRMYVSWISEYFESPYFKTSTICYTNFSYVTSNDIESYGTINIENISLTSMSNVSASYKSTGICCYGDYPVIFSTGAKSDLFNLVVLEDETTWEWEKTKIDSNYSTFSVPTDLSIAIDLSYRAYEESSDSSSDYKKIKVAFNNNGSIVYLEQGDTIGFEIRTPKITVLNDNGIYISNWRDSYLTNGSNVSGLSNSINGIILRDAINPIVLLDETDEIPSESSVPSSFEPISSQSYSSLSSQSIPVVAGPSAGPGPWGPVGGIGGAAAAHGAVPDPQPPDPPVPPPPHPPYKYLYAKTSVSIINGCTLASDVGLGYVKIEGSSQILQNGSSVGTVPQEYCYWYLSDGQCHEHSDPGTITFEPIPNSSIVISNATNGYYYSQGCYGCWCTKIGFTMSCKSEYNDGYYDPVTYYYSYAYNYSPISCDTGNYINCPVGTPFYSFVMYVIEQPATRGGIIVQNVMIRTLVPSWPQND